jgi:hypothetical protein
MGSERSAGAQERAQLDDAFGDAPLAEEVERLRGIASSRETVAGRSRPR